MDSRLRGNDRWDVEAGSKPARNGCHPYESRNENYDKNQSDRSGV